MLETEHYGESCLVGLTDEFSHVLTRTIPQCVSPCRAVYRKCRITSGIVS